MAAAGRRDVAHDVRDLVGEPERNELGIETQSFRLRVRLTREVLEADEGDAASVDDHLARVGCAHADHEHHVDVRVDLEKVAALLFGFPRQRHDVGTREHLRQISAIRMHRRPRDLGKVRAIGIDDVVVPVRLEKLAVTGEVALVSGEAIGAIKNCEEVRQQVDQHLDRARVGGATTSGDEIGRGMIVMHRKPNKASTTNLRVTSPEVAQFFPFLPSEG